MGYPFCDSDCLSVVTSPRHMARPAVFAFSHVPDNACYTTLFLDLVCTLSVLKGDSYNDSLRLVLFLKLGVAKQPGLTAICQYWEYTFVECFPLQTHWHIYTLHEVVQLTECTPSLSFSFLVVVVVLSHHLSEIDVSVNLLDLLSIDNHIILADVLVTHCFSLPQMHVKAYWLADVMDILEHFL